MKTNKRRRTKLFGDQCLCCCLMHFIFFTANSFHEWISGHFTRKGHWRSYEVKNVTKSSDPCHLFRLYWQRRMCPFQVLLWYYKSLRFQIHLWFSASIVDFVLKMNLKNVQLQQETGDTCSWKGQLEKTRSWKVFSWKVSLKLERTDRSLKVSF